MVVHPTSRQEESKSKKLRLAFFVRTAICPKQRRRRAAPTPYTIQPPWPTLTPKFGWRKAQQHSLVQAVSSQRPTLRLPVFSPSKEELVTLLKWVFLFCEKAPAAYSVVRLKTHKEPPTFFMERAHGARLSQDPNHIKLKFNSQLTMRWLKFIIFCSFDFS